MFCSKIVNTILFLDIKLTKKGFLIINQSHIIFKLLNLHWLSFKTVILNVISVLHCQVDLMSTLLIRSTTNQVVSDWILL